MAESPEEREARFEAIFDQTSSMIYNLGLRLFRNEEDALDFAQDVYLRAYDRLDSFRGESRPSTWLYSLALNLGLNRLRSERRLQFDAQAGEQEQIESLSGEGDLVDPLERLTRTEIEIAVRESLQEMPDVYRVPLLLLYFEQLSYGEIAATLKLKEGTLKSYIHRGRLILRSRLAERGIEP
ncbi:MAG: sigma-70 family RNA polymerase sigma factor [Leptospirales bacterium]|nr:sigma-70 family RNA polymerase sigma factor [Leptospirales bacterium]